ncbi:MAG TPA: glycosyltransferase family A protein, partial [Pedococcus sp.]|nr:glycosyltransferase family A protein [Pedococcus sp.]
MTLAPNHGLTGAPANGSSSTAVSVTAILFLRGPAAALPETLDALAAQTRRPERLIVVDPGLDGNAVETVRAHEALSAAIDSIRFVTVPATATLGYAVRAGLADASSIAAQDGSSPVVEYLWVLATDCVAAPTALGRLVDAVRRS